MMVVRVCPDLAHDHVELPMVYAALGHQLVGELPHLLGRALEHHGLQATGMVQVHMGGGYRQIVVGMLQPRQALGEFAFVVVVDIREIGDAGAHGLRGFALLCEVREQQIAYGLGAVAVAGARHEGVEFLGQAVLQGNSETLHGLNASDDRAGQRGRRGAAGEARRKTDFAYSFSFVVRAGVALLCWWAHLFSLFSTAPIFMNLLKAGRVLRRTLWQAVPTVIGVVILNFCLLQLVPGDAADVIAAESGSATLETMAQMRSHFGLDLPVMQQLGAYLNNLAHFSLGTSPRYNMPVTELIGSRLPNTLLLMLAALGTALVVGVLLGSIMASRVGRWSDRVLSVFALLLYSTPSFWLGLMTVVLFSVHLGWLPTGGSASIGANLTGWDSVVDRLRHLVLPALAMSGFYIAIFSRLTRASMLEVSRQDFVRTAQAKGLHPLRVSFAHVLRNALIPVTTVAGMHFGTLLGGAVVVETVFSWPGLGRLAFESVMARDYTVLLGILLLSSLLVILANMLVDLLHAWLDPRIQLR